MYVVATTVTNIILYILNFSRFAAITEKYPNLLFCVLQRKVCRSLKICYPPPCPTVSRNKENGVKSIFSMKQGKMTKLFLCHKV